MLIPVAPGVELAATTHPGPAGAGALVLLHGFTGSAADWAGVVDELTDLRTVVTVEHRGHGGSTNTGDAATYRFDQLVADLTVVLDELDLGPVDLLGHSMGGIVAMRYALAHPDRVRTLVLMDTGAAASEPNASHDMMRGGFGLAEESGVMAVFEAIAPFLGPGEAGDHARAAMRRSYEQLDVVAFTTLGEELLTHGSVLPQLATLAVPTTVLVGETDGLRPEADALAATIPGAVLEVIADAGHSPQVEQRDAWLAVVRAHLQRTSSTA